MSKNNIYPVIYGLLAALLFGSSTPLSKLLLTGNTNISPVLLSALLYLGSGLGLTVFIIIRSLSRASERAEAGLAKPDAPYLIGAIISGGVIAPILLMVSLRHAAASTASLMLNFEVVATTVIAALAFREHIGRQALWAIIVITAASIVLSWDSNNQWEISVSALGVLGACFFWGIDNNLTRKISTKDPVVIVAIKGIAAGILALGLALALRNPMPLPGVWIKSLLLGVFGYGLSIVFFVLAMRSAGAARASAFFGIAPFAGAALSFAIFNETPGLSFLIALALMIAGVALLLSEKHSHKHAHPATEHEHRHCHDDDHHCHEHAEESASNKTHSHKHRHDVIEHFGYHMPDAHHEHEH